MRKQPVAFHDEVMRRFQFLVDQHAFGRPECSEVLLPAVIYHGAGLMISVFLHTDTHDSAGRRVSVLVRLDSADGVSQADLDRLVEAALFAPRHRVASRAHTGEAMRATLEDDAVWIRRLMPVLRGPHALDTMRSANRWETDRGGNPKRRPGNITWKYG